VPPRRRGDESSRDELSRLLIALRGHRSQTEVAELAGLTQAKVSRAERGRFPMPVDDARSYAATLGASTEQLARVGELAEAKIAGDDDEPPTRFAALGGWGPRQATEQLIDILDAPARYDLANGPEIYGLRGTARISGHGDISNDATYWALYCLVTG
jgi:transcriptional regulator with XRE-family HTH domain